MPDSSAICAKLDDVYARIDACRACALGTLALNSGRRMRYKPGRLPVLVVAQNPSHRMKGDHVWGGLDLLFGGVEGVRELAEQLWVSNLVKCCTLQNRPPAPQNIMRCWHWLEEEVDAIRPAKIVALGKPAGEWLEESFDGIPVYHAKHPRYILFTPKEAGQYVERLRIASSV